MTASTGLQQPDGEISFALEDAPIGFREAERGRGDDAFQPAVEPRALQLRLLMRPLTVGDQPEPDARKRLPESRQTGKRVFVQSPTCPGVLEVGAEPGGRLLVGQGDPVRRGEVTGAFPPLAGEVQPPGEVGVVVPLLQLLPERDRPGLVDAVERGALGREMPQDTVSDRAAMGEQARRLASEYGMQAMTDNLLQLYRELLPRAGL